MGNFSECIAIFFFGGSTEDFDDCITPFFSPLIPIIFRFSAVLFADDNIYQWVILIVKVFIPWFL